MMILSQLIDLASLIGGPRFAHQVYLRRLQRYRTFEAEYYLLDHLVDPSRIAIDVGANEGIYAGRLAQLASVVHCFEPIPWFAAELRRKLPPSVVVHQSALSNQAGTAELRIPYRDQVEMHGTSTIERQNPLSGSTHVKEVPCRLERLDDAVNQAVGFIKVDVEGHELAVLEGAARILREDQPVLLIESEKRHNSSAPECIFEFLEGFGYAAVFLQNGSLKGLSAFSSSVNQRVENLHGTRKIHSADRYYVNNFIFVPGRPGG